MFFFFSKYVHAYDIKIGILQMSIGRLYPSATNLIKTKQDKHCESFDLVKEAK